MTHESVCNILTCPNLDETSNTCECEMVEGEMLYKGLYEMVSPHNCSCEIH